MSYSTVNPDAVAQSKVLSFLAAFCVGFDRVLAVFIPGILWFLCAGAILIVFCLPPRMSYTGARRFNPESQSW